MSKKKEKLVCGNLGCQTVFIDWKYKKRKYCSHKCRRKEKIQIQCVLCKKRVDIHNADKKRGRGKYCSKSCQLTAKKNTPSPLIQGEKNRSHKLTKKQVQIIRQSKKTYAALAQQFCINKTYVYKIRKRHVWKYI